MEKSNSEFTFQKIVTDYFNLHRKMYMIYADWYTGWVEVTLKAKTACNTSGIGSVHMVHQKKFCLMKDHHSSTGI